MSFFDPVVYTEWIKVEWYDDCFLQVFDIPKNGGADSKVLLAFNGQEVTGEHLKELLQALPTQEPGSFRIYVSENLDDSKEFETHVAQLLPATFPEDDHYHQHVPSFVRLASQWGSSTGAPAWLSTSFGLPATVKSKLWSSPVQLSSRIMSFSTSVRVRHDDRGCSLSR